MNKPKNINQGLSKMKREQPFRVPDNYFGDFPARLQSRLEAEGKISSYPKNRMISLVKSAIWLAASFALVFMLVYWPVKSFLPGYLAKTNTFTEPATEEDTYLSFVEEMDENSFFFLLQEPLPDRGNRGTDFNDDELLSYLSTNISDYEIYLQTEK